MKLAAPPSKSICQAGTYTHSAPSNAVHSDWHLDACTMAVKQAAYTQINVPRGVYADLVGKEGTASLHHAKQRSEAECV